MPIYEYACKSCGHQLEALQKISDAPLTDCPECGDAGLEKLISAAGFVLKGGGWYVTDFRDKGKNRKPESSGKDDRVAGTDKSDGGTGGTSGSGAKAATSAGSD